MATSKQKQEIQEVCQSQERRMPKRTSHLYDVRCCLVCDYLLAATSFPMNDGDTVVLNVCYNIRLMFINGQVWNSFFVIVIVVVTLLGWWIHGCQ
jgi:hypothetical protein